MCSARSVLVGATSGGGICRGCFHGPSTSDGGLVKVSRAGHSWTFALVTSKLLWVDRFRAVVLGCIDP